MENENVLGKLKKTLKDKCPCCGKNFQIRSKETKTMIRGEEVVTWEDYIVCPNCGNDEYDGSGGVKKKRDRRKPKGEGDSFGY